MIAGRTLFEILSMKSHTRRKLYKIMPPEERESIKTVVKVVGWVKQSVFKTGERNPMKRPDVIAKHKKAMNQPERIDKLRVSATKYWRDPEFIAKHIGKNNGRWKGGISLDKTKYQIRWRLRRLGLPEDFIEASLHQKKKRTNIEMVMEYWLINNGIPYKFQKRIKFPSTYTIVDFFVEPNFCVYVDGHAHQNSNCYGENRQNIDTAIDKELMEMGLIPLRLWYEDIFNGDRPWLILDIPQPKYKQQSLGE